MSKNKTHPRYSYYWLNPSLDKDRLYKVHINYNVTIIEKAKTEKKKTKPQKDSGRQRWMYSRLPPEAQILAWRYVHAKHLLTAEEKEEIEKAKTKKKKTKPQADLISNIEQNEKHQVKYQYIGDSEPIAQGITAFFIKRTHAQQCNESSVLELFKSGESFDIYKWYEAYWDSQKTYVELPNRKLTPPQGRLTEEKFLAKFIEDHLIKEQELYRKSEKFFSNKPPYEEQQTREQFRAYVEGYLEWVAEKRKEIIQGYDTGYTKEQMEKTYDSYIEKRLIKRTDVDKQEFVKAFTGQFFVKPIMWSGKKSRLSRVLWALSNKGQEPKDVNKIFSFHDNVPYHGKYIVDENSFNKKDYMVVE